MKCTIALRGAGGFLALALVGGAFAPAAAQEDRPASPFVLSTAPPRAHVMEYCKSTINSTGHMSRTMVVGSLSISANDNWLHSYSCPSETYGVFLMGATQGRLPFGNGYLCISPFETPIYRLGPPGLTDGVGHSFRHLDMAAMPGSACLVSGSTWNFQCYFRDFNAGGACFNLSSAVAATFVD